MINGVTLHSFTYIDSSGQRHTLDLRRGPTYTSRESCGVWVFEYQAWKIFSTTNQYNRLKADYERASTGGVPIPGYSIILGRATCSQGRNREGFALVSTCGSGRPFDLKFGTGPFKQIIDSINSVDILVRIEAVLKAARGIGLTDPQGFIDEQSASNPISFIDIHTNTISSRHLRDVLKHVEKRLGH